MDLPGLTSLRALAALLVFGYHMGVAAPSRIFGVGYVGVAFFFVLSGFVLTWGSNPERSRSNFYLRRFARIYPSHFVVWLAVLVLPIVSGPRDLPEAVLNLTLLQAWSWRLVDVFSMNGVTWSLSCEMFFYAIFPFVAVATRRHRLRLQWAVVAGLFVLAGVVVVIGSFADPDSAIALVSAANPLVRAPEFLLGVVGARTVQAGYRISGRHVAAVLLLALLGSVFAHGSSALATWAAPVFLVVIVAVAQAAIAGRRVLDQRWLVYCGKVSFCFYLVHQLVLNQVFAELGSGLPQAIAALFLSCALAALLHHAVEVPANRLILRRTPVHDHRS
jgi:peptidoglycan/LPS O-acetylase OafA/YrhL